MDELAALLLQIEWGADEALLDAPADRLRAAPRAGPEPVRTAAAPVAPRPAAARPLDACADLTELRAALASFDGCALRDTATSLVFAEGRAGAALLLVCDPPGAEDDRAGRPMAGPDGAYLDRMLASVALSRADVMIAPVIPWRPPGGRPPSPGEIAQCLPFLHRLIAIARPRVIALAGSLAARALLGPERARARSWTDLAVPGAERPIPALAMPSPSLLIRTPGKRREAWQALCRLRRALDQDIAQS